MKKILFLLFCLLALTEQGCAGPRIEDARISGPWLLTITTPDAGALRVVMDFEVVRNDKDTCGFTAWSQKDMDKKILGKWKAMAARSFGGNFEGGSLMRIVAGKLFGKDSLAAILVSPFGNKYFDGRLVNGKIEGVLSDGARRVNGSLTGTKGSPALPLRNYQLICDSLIAITERKLYDPVLLQGSAWLDFKASLQKIAGFTGDDAALVMGFFYFARTLPFSHFYLLPATDRPVAATGESGGNVTLQTLGPSAALLRIRSFGGTSSEMDSIFHIVSAANYPLLLVDLRDNPGGAIDAGMAFAGHLMSDTLYGGIFLTRRYFATHKAIPAPETYYQYPLFSAANHKLLLQGISDYEALGLVAYPRPPVFRGKVVILVNVHTASTCEPLIYALRQSGRAILAGTKSAGAMLNGETFDVGEGFTFTLPTATYYTADGQKIDQQGVMPDFNTGSSDALDFAMRKWINGQ